MATLLADGWFYISAGGFLVSSVLFVFLLGQYRAAVEAEDDADVAAPVVEAIKPVEAVKPMTANALPEGGKDVGASAPTPVRAKPAEEPAPLKPVEAPAPKPVEKPAEAPKAEQSSPKLSETLAQVPKAEPAKAAEPAKKKDPTATGGISPAVVYMQNLKLQIDHLDKEIDGLKTIAAQQSAQSEAILKRLSELDAHVESAKPAPAPVPEDHSQDILQKLAELSSKLENISVAAAAAPAIEEAPAPVAEQPAAEPIAEAPAPEPAPVEPEPVPGAGDPVAEAPAPVAEPAPAPVADADQTQVIDPALVAAIPDNADANKTLVVEPPQEISLQPAEPKADSPAPQEAPAEPKPARKGPVWPI